MLDSPKFPSFLPDILYTIVFFIDLRFSLWRLYSVEDLAKKPQKSENRTTEYIFLYNFNPDFFEADLFIGDESWFHH